MEKNYAAEKQQQLDRISQEHEVTKTELIQARSVVGDQAAQIAAATEREAVLKQERVLQDAKLIELQRFGEATRDRDLVRKQRIEGLSDRIAKWAYIAAWIVFALFGVLSLLTGWSYLFAVPFATVGVLNIAAGLSGGAIRRFVRQKVEGQLHKIIE